MANLPCGQSTATPLGCPNPVKQRNTVGVPFKALALLKHLFFRSQIVLHLYASPYACGSEILIGAETSKTKKRYAIHTTMLIVKQNRLLYLWQPKPFVRFHHIGGLEALAEACGNDGVCEWIRTVMMAFLRA